jgi:hypothetical protein
MPISRGMMERQLRMGGGIMNIVPREEAFLGGLKKAIKGVAKGIGSFIKSDAGKMALTAGALYGLGGGTFFGKSLPGIAGTGFKAGNILSNIKNMPFLGKAVGALGLSALTGGMPQPEVGSIGSNPSAIRSYLREYFTNLNPQRDNEEDEEYEARINQLVESNMVEYMSDGGRIGFFLGGNFQQSEKQAQRDRDISRKEAARPDDSGPSTPPPSVLARKPKVNIPTPDKSDDRGILATVGDYFSNLPNPLFTPAAAADLNIEEQIKNLEQLKKDQKKKLTIADDTVAKGIGTGDILTSVPDLKDPKVAGGIAKAGGLSTSLKKVGGKKIFGSDLILGGEQISVPSKSSQQAIEEIQRDKRELGLTKEQVIDKAKDFDYPTSITEEGASTIYDMVEAYQDFPKFAAEGGRIGYARGDSAEDNAMQAAGVMGLPLNQNPAGITELDLRETGGFIPPVGVKEKADDIPAMLSNNEFVFTADAVRGMGDGDVNKGAQRMYDMMKRLENGGRV